MNTGASAIVLDTEWSYRSGRTGSESAWVPVVLCALILFSGQELVFLPGRDDRHLADFLVENKDALWVAHSITAEMKYLLRLGLPVPERWYDTLVAERWLTNRSAQPKVGLAAALDRRNLGHLVWSDKSEFRDRILTLDFQPDGTGFMNEVTRYCLQDCQGCAALFKEQIAPPENRVKLERLMSWYPRYQLAVSRMESGIRKKYKTVSLGVLYGLTAWGTAAKLGISYQEAENLHRVHHRSFPEFWRWSERVVVSAINRGSIRTRLGWRALVDHDSNGRTWANWPMQANGADIMRLTIMYMDEAKLAILAPVHDGFLLSCRRDEIDATRRKVDYACASAVEHVLGGFKLKWTVTIHDARFEDPDGLPLWETVQRLLQELSHDRKG